MFFSQQRRYLMYTLYCCSICDFNSKDETKARECQAQGKPRRKFKKGQKVRLRSLGTKSGKKFTILKPNGFQTLTHVPLYLVTNRELVYDSGKKRIYANNLRIREEVELIP
jgi:hypothetical protein